jgi:GT2 family glycosyltransferase
MKNPKVSVISTWWGKPIDGWMDSIKKQSYRNIEIVAGTEKDFGINERKGAGFMRNFLSKKSTGDILFFIDADAIMKGDCIEHMVKIFEEKDVDAISGLPAVPPREESSFLNHLLGVEYEERIRAMGENYVSVAASTCFAVKKDTFDRLGGFTEMFKGGIGEDWHFSTVMTKQGYRIWHTNKAQIYHYTAETFFKYLKKQFYHSWYRVYHTKKFGKARDEYPLLKLNLKKYDTKEKIIFPFFYLLRLCVWILGGTYGIYTFYIRKQYK